MASHKITMGIDVGSTSVKTIITGKEKNQKTPVILGTGASPSYGLRKGIIVNPEDVANTIKKSVKLASEKLDTKPKRAFVSIGGTGIKALKATGSVVISRADQEISKEDLKRAINQSESQLKRNSSSYFLNREIIHFFPISYKIDDDPVIGNPVGMKGEKLEVETLFITSLSHHLNNLIKSVEMAGITPENVVADSLAMSKALLTKKEKEVGCLVANIGGDTSSIIVFEEGNPISLEIFPIGSNHITYDIAQGFQLLLDEADQLKFSYSNDTTIKRKLNPIIIPRLNDIFDLIDVHLNKIKRSRLLPAGAIITGGGANLAGINEIAKDQLKIPVQSNQISFGEDQKNNIINDPSWSVAIGLCCSAIKEENNNLIANTSAVGKKAKQILWHCVKNFLP